MDPLVDILSGDIRQPAPLRQLGFVTINEAGSI